MASSLPPARESRRLLAVKEKITEGPKCCEDIRCLALNLAQEADELERKALLDTLTNIWNRGAIMDIAARELSVGAACGRPVGLLLLDVDHFKRVNDTYGHQVGDEVLVQVASRILYGVRPTDSVGRYGGEEFMIVLPDCSEADVFVVSERVRSQISCQAMFLEGAVIPITASVGCTVSLEGRSDTRTMLKAADQGLYQAKNAGRNRTVFRSLMPTLRTLRPPRL
jgi:diguanylate cyclase (GGDEF)-like protein